MTHVVYQRDMIKTTEQRLSMAKLVSATIEANHHRSGELPYNLGSDDTFWHVDGGNDWWLKFHDDEVTMEIRHRYDNVKALEGISTWIAYRTGGKVVAP